jgi:hypothetical protein
MERVPDDNTFPRKTAAASRQDRAFSGGTPSGSFQRKGTARSVHCSNGGKCLWVIGLGTE